MSPFKKLRTMLGYSRGFVSKETGLSPETIQRHENGFKRTVSTGKLRSFYLSHVETRKKHLKQEMKKLDDQIKVINKMFYIQ